jgi:hypothetical protein
MSPKQVWDIVGIVLLCLGTGVLIWSILRVHGRDPEDHSL